MHGVLRQGGVGLLPRAPSHPTTLRTYKGEAQLAQAEVDEDGLPDDSQLFAEQAGGWGLTHYVMHIGWNEFGQKVRQIAGNFVETKYSYREKTRRLAGIDSFNRDDFQRMQNQPGQHMQQLRYEYDLVGNIVALRNDAPYSNTANASVLIATTSQSFEYDKLYQLKSASGVMQDRNDWRYTYSFAQEYDAVGNIVFKDQSAWRQVPDNGSWRNDNQNRDISYASTYSYGGSQAHAPNVIAEQLPNESSAYSRVLSYDASGNQVQNAFRGHTRSIVWNEDDQVKQVIRDGQELNRTLYDAQGQKAVHLHRVSGNEETAYLGPNLTIRDGKYITKHVFAGSERVSSKMDPAWFQYPPTMYYHSDHLGSAQYVTIDNQEMVQHAEYLPSGELWQNASDSRFELARRFLFTGKELDIHTGLYDFGARQYDARQGQWLSPDPILVDYMQGRVNAGVYWPAQLGLYTFVANNPIKLVDPNGAEIILFGNAQEQRRVLGLLQKLTSDRLALRGDRVIIQSLGPDQSPKSVGTLLLRRLRHSERNVTIMAIPGVLAQSESRTAAADRVAAENRIPTDANVYLDERPGVALLGLGKDGKVEVVEDAPPEITLAHELIHAESLITGTADFNQATNSCIKRDGSQRTEIQDQEEFITVGISKPKPATENAIRREQGLRERQAVEPQ